MKRDFNKICIRTILTYFIIIFMICLLKVINIDYFGIKYDNNLINKFSEFVTNYKLENVWYSITLYIYTYFILSISCKDNSKKMKIYALIITLIGIPYKFLMNTIPIKFIRSILEIIFLTIPPIIYTKEFKNTFKNIFIYLILNTLFQATALYCKNLEYKINDNFITNIMLDIDYMIISLLFYYYYFEREEIEEIWEMVAGFLLDLWHGFTQLPGLFLELLRHLIYGLKKQTNTMKKVLKSKRKEKIDNIIFLSLYYLLTLLWNVFTIILKV